MILVINSYVDANPKRHAENVLARELNEKAKHVDRIIDVMPGKRATFKDMFAATQDVPANSIVCFSNSDIDFVSDTVRLMEHLAYGECFALSRYENGVLFHHPDGSQDCWAFRGPPPLLNGIDFPPGSWGCDNVLARILVDSGWTIYNPSKSIITNHHHASGIRTANRASRIVGEEVLVPACTIEQVRTNGPWRVTSTNCHRRKGV